MIWIQEDDASSILNDGVVSDGECLLDKEWQNTARLDHDGDELATADGTVLGAHNIDLNHNWIADLDQFGGFDQLIHDRAVV